MMNIDANTKIATLLKEAPASLEAIISIAPKFNKLRNPVLRRIMAGRTSIGMASKIGGCSVDDFFEVLEPLGFKIDWKKPYVDESISEEKTEFLRSLKPSLTVQLDVRPAIATGNDPLKQILAKLKSLKSGMVLKLINSFEPLPLIVLLNKQGYESLTEVVSADCIVTYFYQLEEKPAELPDSANHSDGWGEMVKRFEGKIITIDVRALEMPLPMTTILESLDKLPSGNALFVYHKRIPVFLLPELAERKFDYRVKEINPSEVHLLIFKG